MMASEVWRYALCFQLLVLQVYPSSATQAITDALRNTLILPLKQIHDALEPLEQIRDDLSALATRPRPNITPHGQCDFGLGSVVPHDCGDLYRAGYTESGVYIVYLYTVGQWSPVSVYCDMDTDEGGWLVFQRRQDGSENFYRNWETYLKGFGNITGDFWIGNALLHHITGWKDYELRVDLQDHNGGSAYAKYDQFYVGPNKSWFELHVKGYTGTAGDALSYHNAKKFSTKDRENDETSAENCAVVHKGGWWYRACHTANLNAVYHERGQHNATSRNGDITWSTWHGNDYSLKVSEMKIRPYDF